MLVLKIQVPFHFRYSHPNSDPNGFVPGLVDLLPALHRLCEPPSPGFRQAESTVAHSVAPVSGQIHVATKANPHVKK